MIKINLAPSADMKAGLGNSSNELFADDANLFVSSDEIRKDAAVRLLILMLCPVGLYVYESQVIPEKRAKVESLQQNYDALIAFNASGAQIVERIKKLNSTKELFDKRLAAIDELRRNRYREVRILDVLQTSIPETSWFKEVEMLKDRIVVNGYSMSDADTTKFLDDLNRSSHIKEVRLLRSIEETVEGNLVKRFEIECIFDSPKKVGANI